MEREDSPGNYTPTRQDDDLSIRPYDRRGFYRESTLPPRITVIWARGGPYLSTANWGIRVFTFSCSPETFFHFCCCAVAALRVIR